MTECDHDVRWNESSHTVRTARRAGRRTARELVSLRIESVTDGRQSMVSRAHTDHPLSNVRCDTDSGGATVTGPQRGGSSAARWQDKATEMLPEVALPESWSVHVYFGELLDLVRDAHRRQDCDVLLRAYGFAQWCLDQPGRFLANAAVVSFYEHLFDDWELRHEVAGRLPEEVVRRVRQLWEWRLPAEQLAAVDRLLGCRDLPPFADRV